MTVRTVSAIELVLVNVPELPVIVTVALPVVAVLLALRVNVLFVVEGLGANTALTPDGNPDAERVTLPEKPFSGAMEILLVLLES